MPRIAILGGGYAGVIAARTLAAGAPGGVEITLVDRGLCHGLITQLPYIVSGRIDPSRACIPYERILPPVIRRLAAEITAVDPAGGRIDTTAGPLAAETTILALGSVPTDLGVQDASRHSIPLKSVGDAVRVRDRLRSLRSTRPLTRVVIVGGGYTGCEVAGELADSSFLRDSLGALDITIVQPDPRLLPHGNAALAERAERILRSKRVRLIFNTWLSQIRETAVVLREGPELPADIVIWAARTGTSPAVRKGPFHTTTDGRIPTDAYLRSVHYPNWFVVGDLASSPDLVRGGLLPASAQVAAPAGEVAAENLLATFLDRPLHEFHHRHLGEALTLGGRDAVADLTGFTLTGLPALGVKRAALARYLSRFGSAAIVRDFS